LYEALGHDLLTLGTTKLGAASQMATEAAYMEQLAQYTDEYEYEQEEPEELHSLVQYEELLKDKNGRMLNRKGEVVDAKEADPHLQKPSDRNFLNALLPPVLVGKTADDVDLFREVSGRAASREDVLSLTQQLDEKLEVRQARERGICPVREQLYSQCFNEVIRQMALSCPERGLMAVRIRDEATMTIAAYQTLYQASQSFGARKQLQAQQSVGDLQAKVDELNARKTELEKKTNALAAQLETIEKRAAEQRQLAQKKMAEEKDFLKHQRTALEAFLKTEQAKQQ